MYNNRCYFNLYNGHLSAKAAAPKTRPNWSKPINYDN